jgi:hypothetical protein
MLVILIQPGHHRGKQDRDDCEAVIQKGRSFIPDIISGSDHAGAAGACPDVFGSA